jgi:cation/acetate symporter|tara:strand:- start:1321 stop:1455 length:135 start_codon:yes stop_codon:yes gene_type:complete
MLINFVVSLVVMRFTPPPPTDVQELVENICIPGGEKDIPVPQMH